jgi:8-oxo-dGTP pyrophosphatase MutT (NUDIX family)
MAKTFIDKITLIHIENRRILMARSRGKDAYYTPGGKREPGESDAQALVREIKEELQVELLPQTMERYGIFEAQAHGKPGGVIVRLACYTAKFIGRPQPGAEIESLAYCTYARRNVVGPVGRLLFDDLKAKGIIL